MTTKDTAKDTSTRDVYPGISDFQMYLFNKGENFQAYKMLGVHKMELEGKTGYRFAVWAPNAKSVSLTGSFNNWSGDGYVCEKIGTSGVWCGFFCDIKEGDLYKYHIEGCDGIFYDKADPYAVASELRPGTASKVYELSDFKWTDKAWISKREKTDWVKKPVNIYEVHPGSWKTHDDGSFLTYRELADDLIPYAADMGYTHIELMPVTEYPFDGSWGYQVTGYFSATSRYGAPEDLKYFINKCHKFGIGVIMDWVPAHFPRDAHGLRMFDGGPVYEYADTRMGEHKDWGTMVFDYSRFEVISFLLSSAYFWADEYHFDGLRVDAVSSMLYRNYSRNDGEWIANIYGGSENLEAISFFQKLNSIMLSKIPGFMMIAEESTAWPNVTKPAEDGGLGFSFKWNMGWMNDNLRYMSMDPYFRRDNHSLLTFLMMYAYSENFILPLSHDEVVHGKASLVNKMFGSYDDKFSSYRTMLGFYMAMPGKKLLFMGGEIAQFIEWRYYEGLEWKLLDFEKHRKFKDFIKDINNFYKENKSFWELEQSWEGFSWINPNDNQNSVVSFLRKGKRDRTIIVANFTPVDRENYPIGVPSAGEYEVVLTSDDVKYGGNGKRKTFSYKAVKKPYSEFSHTININIEGNTILYIKKKRKTKKD